ncbi:MAG: 2-octaprenyl-6-methoxyphenyl hydroxylase [Pseudomonadota bacterium]
MTDSFDVVIAGGGLVGATLGIALADSGQSVAVVEAAESHDAQPGFDSRATALSQTSIRVLATLGVWPGASHASPIRRIRVSDRGHFGATRLDADQHDLDAFGYVIENQVLGQALTHRLLDVHVRQFRPAHITSATPQPGGVALKLSDDQRVDAGLLVIAEGAQSRTRDLLGVGVETTHYGRTAVVANIATEQPHEGRAYERFTRDGPLAVLPLTRGRSNVVWSVADQDADALVTDDAVFRERFQHAFGFRLGHVTRAGVRSRYPLARIVARQLHEDHWVVIGNSANAMHPVAGQGLNLGLRDVACLSELAWSRGGRAWPDVLQSYAQWRHADHRDVRRMTHSLVQVFAEEAAPYSAARGAALIAMQIAPPLRRWFARRSMGYRERLPKLARGVALG